MRMLVLGNGASGRAAAALAARLGYETVTLDGDDVFPEGAAFDAAVVSPGIPLDHPWQVRCRAAGIPARSELQFGCEELKRRGWKLLAVTGSKGKSSVVKLVADALARAGRRAVPCGNYGRAVCDVACAPEDRRTAEGSREARDDATEGSREAWAVVAEGSREAWAVVEVSSFQLETTTLAADTFEAAAILNLQEDHLDRHGSVAVYHALKRKLLGFAKRPLDCGATGVRALPRDACDELFAGSYFDNEILRSNGAAAVFLLRAAGLGDETIRAAFVAFEPLPHRMNVVGVFGGVTCIDDSKATSLAALAAGVKMASARAGLASPVSSSRLASPVSASRLASPVSSSRLASPVSSSRLSPLVSCPPSSPSLRLIAGGLPKGDDPASVLRDLTARVKKVYLIGQSAEQFFSVWSESVACEICGTMDRAVKAAMREARSGETVLLSPGTASFDQFHSYGERGDVFADLVKKEGTYK